MILDRAINGMTRCDRSSVSPEISIIINNYNYGRFLSAAIDSALAQSRPAFEVIVVDDGSTDNSREIIASYETRIIPVLRSNRGQTSAFNAGFQQSRGQIIFFLDADDFLELTALEEASGAFVDREVIKVHWPLWIIGPDGKKTGRRKPSHRLAEGNLIPRLLDLGPDDPAWVPTSGNAWRRDYLSQIFPLPELERRAGVGSASADAYMSMLAPLFGKVARVETPQGNYRVHGMNDHSCMEFEKRLHRDVALFEERLGALSEYCEQAGIEIDPHRWRENAWCHKLKRGLEAVGLAISPEEQFILVDDLTWQLPVTERYRYVPFLEKNGQYSGSPSNAQQAIRELERLKREGARYIVFAWPSFWWLELFPELERYLRSNFRCAQRTSEAIIYNLLPARKQIYEEALVSESFQL